MNVVFLLDRGGRADGAPEERARGAADPLGVLDGRVGVLDGRDDGRDADGMMFVDGGGDGDFANTLSSVSDTDAEDTAPDAPAPHVGGEMRRDASSLPAPQRLPEHAPERRAAPAPEREAPERERGEREGKEGVGSSGRSNLPQA